jgi:hypothetical protein
VLRAAVFAGGERAAIIPRKYTSAPIELGRQIIRNGRWRLRYPKRLFAAQITAAE